MKWIVNNPDGYATSLREFAGSNLILTNSSATDIYYDVQLSGTGLNSTAPGVIPIGTKIASGGGTVYFEDAPRELWVRAITQAVLDVQGNAVNIKPGSQTVVQAGDSRGGNNVPPKPPIQIGAHMRSRIFNKC